MPLEKYKKECDVVKVTLVQGFCSLKITVTQFWNHSLGCAQKERFPRECRTVAFSSCTVKTHV